MIHYMVAFPTVRIAINFVTRNTIAFGKCNNTLKKTFT